MEKSILFNVDSYKHSHFLQYPEGTTQVTSYIEPRKISKDFNFSHVMFFGLQMFIKEYLLKPITQEEINNAEIFWKEHGEPFNKEGWEYILNVHNGYLPLCIEALPEGTVHDISIPQVQVWNTDPKCFWLTSFIETALLRSVWYPSTVATLSWNIKQYIKSFLEETCDNPDSILPFRLHDFGARGVSSLESAGIGGLAHLVNFMGTDTATSILYAKKYYDVINMPAYSIPASEHSTITSWGKENESKAYKNMIDKFSGEGKLYACVSDSYDIFEATSEIWGNELKNHVINSGGTLIVRPDSGDPVYIVRRIIEILGEKYGYTVNKKGYKVLHPSVKVIQGDGINMKSISEILHDLKKYGWSSENVAFGMGGKLLQGIDRDTLSYAMKCNEVVINDKKHDVFKKPVTDNGKSSKAGKQIVLDENNNSMLQTVYMNGTLKKSFTFDKVRENSQTVKNLKSEKLMEN